MRNYPNIEPARGLRGAYIGYNPDGVKYLVRPQRDRAGRVVRWDAQRKDALNHGFHGRTLADISRTLQTL